MGNTSLKIHPTAIVDPGARLESGVVVGPYSIIEANVSIGENTTIGAHCLIAGHTKLGKRNRIFTGAVIGSEPQDVKYHGENCFLEIGDDNYIREYVTINPGTGEGTKTVIGNDNWLMIQTHIGHNCILGNHIKLANLATLGGHVQVEDYVTIGGVTPVHQFVRIGCYSMIGGGFRAVQDVVPYMIAGDEPLRIFGVNQIGLERNDFSKETMDILKKAYKVIFRNNLTLKEAIQTLSNDFSPINEVKHLIEFLSTSTRGIVR